MGGKNRKVERGKKGEEYKERAGRQRKSMGLKEEEEKEKRKGKEKKWGSRGNIK